MAMQIKNLILRYLSYFWEAKSKGKSEATDPVAMSSGKTNTNQYTVGEFFSGIGGTRLGVEQAGFKVVVSSEIDSHCIKTYKLELKKILVPSKKPTCKTYLTFWHPTMK